MNRFSIHLWLLALLCCTLLTQCGLFDNDPAAETTPPEIPTDLWQATALLEPASELVQLSDGSIYANTGPILRRTNDPMQQWAPEEHPFTTIYDIEPGDGHNDFYAVTDSGLYQQTSVDNWTQRFDRRDLTLMTRPETENLVVSDLRGKLYQSTDNGGSWSGPDTVVAEAVVTLLATRPNGNILASFSRDGVWESVNDSLNFRPTPLRTERLLDLDHSDQRGLFAASATQGLLKLPSGASSWSASTPANQPNRRASAVWISKNPGGPNLVLLALEGSGIYGSTDGGEQWVTLNDEDLPSTILDIVAIQMTNNEQRLLLATNQGVWISLRNPADIAEIINRSASE